MGVEIETQELESGEKVKDRRGREGEIRRYMHKHWSNTGRMGYDDVCMGRYLREGTLGAWARERGREGTAEMICPLETLRV